MMRQSRLLLRKVTTTVDPHAGSFNAISWACEKGYADFVKLLLADSRTASKNGHVEVVKLLLEDPRVDPSAEHCKAIRLASDKCHSRICHSSKHYTSKRHADIVTLLLADSRISVHELDRVHLTIFLFCMPIETATQMLLNVYWKNLGLILAQIITWLFEWLPYMATRKLVDPSANDNDAIQQASRNGHFEVVKTLLEDARVDPSSNANYAIRSASECGHADVVRILLKDPRVDPGIQGNFAIKYASSNGHIDVVKLLLKDSRVDPCSNDNNAIRAAFNHDRDDVVNLLIQDARVFARALENGTLYHFISYLSDSEKSC
ncbi:hypothetical protein ROZALSC1DRAFT_29074 [Rozella allomycis CSF55]|uniref:Uncharacterized protein n=1 Tax=Rozella allomycis (strain CSF55) TaxID=988480 RepID=A0A4P9YIX5_ROZAC|nr:hypothetical protein ROZALSC1DRAFT_29074 [Rozella allomycis CSF55]